MPLSNMEFLESRCSENHALRKGLDDVLPFISLSGFEKFRCRRCPEVYRALNDFEFRKISAMKA